MADMLFQSLQPIHLIIMLRKLLKEFPMQAPYLNCHILLIALTPLVQLMHLQFRMVELITIHSLALVQL